MRVWSLHWVKTPIFRIFCCVKCIVWLSTCPMKMQKKTVLVCLKKGGSWILCNSVVDMETEWKWLRTPDLDGLVMYSGSSLVRKLHLIIVRLSGEVFEILTCTRLAKNAGSNCGVMIAYWIESLHVRNFLLHTLNQIILQGCVFWV